MKKKVRTDQQVKTIFWVGMVICVAIALFFHEHISQIFLVAVLWYAYWYMTVKRPHELRKLLEEEARQEAAWRAEQERLRAEREAEADTEEAAEAEPDAEAEDEAGDGTGKEAAAQPEEESKIN